MAGATLEFDNAAVLRAIRAAADALANPDLLLRDMGEHLMIVHQQRFAAQQSPDGTPWLPLSPAYLKRKKKNKNKILQLDAYLANTLRYQLSGAELLFGSNRIYAAIQHFGGQIDMPARSQDAYFKQDRSGRVGNQFVSKRKSNFAQRVTIGNYTITIPARPWLGTSAQDDEDLLQIGNRYLANAISAGGA